MTVVQPIPFRPEGPQPLVRDVPPGRPYPLEALGPLRAAVEAVQAMTGAPMAIPAQSALSVASLAVQAHADVEALGGPAPLSVYALTIAESGARKSSCDRPLMEGLREHEREANRALREEVTAWQNRHALWKGERERILTEAKRGKGEKRTAAQADLAALGAEPAAPPSQDRTVTEPTFEGLTRLFAQGQPSLGIFSDEGGQFLGGHGMGAENRQKTLAALNDLWGGNPIRRTRAGEGSYTLFGRRLAVHLMVQPVVARAFMADSLAGGTGFLPRFLICEPPSTIGRRLSATLRTDPRPVEAFAQRLRTILAQAMPMTDPDTRELTPRHLPLATEARALLVRFSDEVETRQAPGGDLAHVTGYASKSAEQAARIAGVLTLWGNLGAGEVQPDTMADAIALADFYLSEAARLADGAAMAPEVEQAERLRRWLVETWREPEVLPSDILRYAPVRALRDRPTASKATARLVEAGWLVTLEQGATVRGKSRREAFRVVREASE
ncbi:YfjI family protein [Rubellimicrobium arenae]|uniref:YfjI family protein n=1 Tax=Rubellimicrobium arenae TaxID=2817372 RepID=UPI001B3040CD|nr:YfjI family protein [Rubellimicrobium arenae]